jgi:hypothetical protein
MTPPEETKIWWLKGMYKRLGLVTKSFDDPDFPEAYEYPNACHIEAAISEPGKVLRQVGMPSKQVVLTAAAEFEVVTIYLRAEPTHGSRLAVVLRRLQRASTTPRFCISWSDKEDLVDRTLLSRNTKVEVSQVFCLGAARIQTSLVDRPTQGCLAEMHLMLPVHRTGYLADVAQKSYVDFCVQSEPSEDWDDYNIAAVRTFKELK